MPDARPPTSVPPTGQDRLQRVLDSMFAFVGQFSLDGTVIEMNRALLEAAGLSREDVIGKPFVDAYWWSHSPAAQSKIRDALERAARGETVRGDFAIRVAGGRIITMDAVFGPLRDASGRIVEIVGSAVDVTERKAAEEAALGVQARLNAALEAGGMGTWVWEIPADRILWDESVNRLFGRPRAEIENCSVETFLSFLHPDDRERTRVAIQATIEHDRAYEVEYRVQRPAGEAVWIAVKGRLERDSEGRPARMTGAWVDTTARRESEAALRESEERLRQLAEGMGEAFWLSEPGTGRALYVNPAYERIWGRSSKSLYESPSAWAEAIHPADRSRVLHAGKTRIASGDYEEEYRIVRPDGTERWIRDRAFPIHDAGGRLIRVAGIAEDITDRRQLETQLVQAQKMESIGRLAGGVAHDFNNLLTVISGNTELLQALLPEGELSSDLLEEIRKASDRAVSLTQQLLMFSRQEVLEPVVLDLNLVVADTESMLRRLLGADLQLTTTLSSEPALAKVDAGHLVQILMNLAINARDAMPKGGRLAIDTALVELDDAHCRGHPGVRPGRYVLLQVRDTGHGMTPEVLTRIFEPFYTTKEQGRGTGLGLAVVHGIVSQSGGHIEVSSEPDQETTFRIYLPAVDAPAPTRGDSRAVQGRSGTETVLLAEDDDSVRRLTARGLANSGYVVLEACDGLEALRILDQHRGQVDLVISDVIMPGMSGPELGAELRERFPKTRILYTSGYTDDAIVRHGIQHGEVAFIQKPFTPTALARKVREVLDDSPG